MSAHTQCKDIIPLLQTYAFNHPRLSAIAVKKSEGLYCSSTVEPIYREYIDKDDRISGPLTSPKLKAPFFIIRYKIDGHIFDLFVLASEIKRALHSENSLIGRVDITDNRSHKSLMSWELPQYTEDKENRPNWFQSLSMPIVERDEITLWVYNNPRISYRLFWEAEILKIALVLLFLVLTFFLLQRALNRRFSLEGEIRKAIRVHQFIPVYQPLYDWRKEGFTAVEVLIRWKNGKGKLIMPASFIKEAESTGLIIPITRQIIRQSFSELSPWLKTKAEHHIAININKIHIESDSLMRFLILACKKFSIPPSQVLLELSERDLISDNDQKTLDRLTNLKRAGFRLAIDDFGTGHASIKYLNHIPLDYLKVDMMYTSAIGTDSAASSLIEPIILLAKSLELGIIAEGVETREQEEYLMEQNVDYLQGWLYAKAMRIEAFMQFIEGHQLSLQKQA